MEAGTASPPASTKDESRFQPWFWCPDWRAARQAGTFCSRRARGWQAVLRLPAGSRVERNALTPPAGTRSWHNLTIGRATVDRLLDRYDWYEPYLPPERLAAASYADVWKLEDIAVELIVEYADRFWRSQRRMWEH